MVAACGPNKSEEAEAQPQDGASAPLANELITESLQATGDSDPNALKFSSEEADCTADAIVTELDVARLEELGLDLDEGVAPVLTQPPLTIEEGDIVFGAFEACVDLPSQIGASFAADPTLDEQGAKCVTDEYLASGLVREALLGGGFDQDLNDRIDATLADAYHTCSS